MHFGLFAFQIINFLEDKVQSDDIVAFFDFPAVADDVRFIVSRPHDDISSFQNPLLVHEFHDVSECGFAW